MSIKQKEKIVILDDGRRVTVSRMPWRKASEFHAMFSKARREVLEKGNLLSAITKASEAQNDTPEQISAGVDVMCAMDAMVPEMMPVYSFLAYNSTALPSSDIDAMCSDDVLSIVRASLELELNEDVKNSLGGLGLCVVGLNSQK
jgi:hypothetical protein